MRFLPLLLLAAAPAAAQVRVWAKPGAPAPIAQVRAVALARLSQLDAMPTLEASRSLARTDLSLTRAEQQGLAAVRMIVAIPTVLNGDPVRKAAEKTLGDELVAKAVAVAGKLHGAAESDPAAMAALAKAQDRVFFRAVALANELSSRAGPTAREPGAVWTEQRFWTTRKGKRVPIARMSDRNLVNAARLLERNYRSGRLEFQETDYAAAARAARTVGDLFPVYDSLMQEISRRPKAILLYEQSKGGPAGAATIQ